MAESQNPTEPPVEGPLDVSGEFADMIKKREAYKSAVAQSFIENSVWLAQQKDPFQQLMRITQQEHMKTFAQKLEANQQFSEIAKTGKTDATRIFDLMVSMYLYNIDPEKFFKTIRDYEQKLRTEKMNSVTKINNDMKFDLEKFLKKDEGKSNDTEKNTSKIKPFGLRRPSGFILDESGSMQEPKNNKPFNQEEFMKKLEEILKKLPKKKRDENESDEENKI